MTRKTNMSTQVQFSYVAITVQEMINILYLIDNPKTACIYINEFDSIAVQIETTILDGSTVQDVLLR